MARTPRWSVIVPTRGRPGPLAACLRALALQEPVGTRIEVIVVDDDPGRGAAVIVERLAGAYPHPLRAIASAGRGPAAARNAGAAVAAGALLAFTDDDCRPGPSWLAELGAKLETAPGAGAAGRTVDAAGGGSAAASQLVVDAFVAAGARAGELSFGASNNLALPAAGLAAIGGFDEGFPLAAAEDRDLCERWRESGRRLVAAPRAVVHHHHAMGPGGLWRQHFRYGRGARAFHRSRSRRGRPRTGLQPRFYAELAARVGGLSRGRARAAALVTLAQLAGCAGYGAELLAPAGAYGPQPSSSRPEISRSRSTSGA